MKTKRKLNNQHNIDLRLCSENEIHVAVSNLKINIIVGTDNITVNDILLVMNKLIPIITKPISKILIFGKYLQEFKIAKVIPVYMKEEKSKEF